MEQKEKKIFMIGMSIVLVFVLLLGGTYAWLTLSLTGTKVNVLKAGNLSLILNDENSVGINSDKAVPMLDEVGETLDPYHFTLENHGEDPSEYTIFLDDMDLEENETRIADDKIKYSLVKDGKKTTALFSTTGENPNRVLDTGKINGGQTITYDLRLWIDKDAGNEVMGQVLRTKIRVVAIQTDELLNDASSKCFVFDNTTGTITDYLCVEGNTSDLPVLTEFAIPSTIDGVEVKVIGGNAFKENNLTKVMIPNTITTIGSRAFENNQLTSVTIPNSVTTIERLAFYNNQLTNVTIPSSVTSIGERAFAQNQLTNVTIPSSVTLMGSGAFTNNKLPDNEAFIYNRNSNGSINTTSLNSYGWVKRDNIVIPNGVVIIEAYAFSNCQINHVTIPNGVTTIESSSFNGNQLTSVMIPASVTSIGGSAFHKSTTTNPNLTKIVNKTGRSFRWGVITASGNNVEFVTGTITHKVGNIVVTAS